MHVTARDLPRLHLCLLLRLLPLDNPLPDIRRSLLHGIELPIPRHLRIVFPILAHQPLHPLLLPLALTSWRLLRAVQRSLLKFPDNWVRDSLVLSALRHHGETVPLGILVVILDIVQGVVERVVLGFECACYAEDSAGFGVALDFDFLGGDVLGLLGFGDDIQGVGCAVCDGVCAGRFLIVEAEKGDGLFCATGCVVESRCQTEAAVVLR